MKKIVKPSDFDNIIRTELGVDSYFGVPDSVLKHFCAYIINEYGLSNRHIVGVNEGNCAALAAGSYLASGHPSCVYMQNSGIGNIVNPVLSLTSDEVYGIPVIYIIGWRGAPGESDEPQHIAQGSRTEELLKLLGISYTVIDKNTAAEDLRQSAEQLKPLLDAGKSVCFLVKKNAFAPSEPLFVGQTFTLSREWVLETIITQFPEDTFLATTGVVSRELFETRERLEMPHDNDFLTIGSMGHASAIALGVAMKTGRNGRIWCFDGDGAVFMHMGAMATIGSSKVTDFVHVLFNNTVHESVGGIPTSGATVDFCGIADSCGYDKTLCVNTQYELTEMLKMLSTPFPGKLFAEIRIKAGSRADLGRPTITPKESKKLFMSSLQER